MMNQISLLLICMIFSTGLSLKCHKCDPFSACNNEEIITCPDQCLTATSYLSGMEVLMMGNVSIKRCGSRMECTNTSINLGKMKMVHNSKCCKSDFCNSETLKVLPKQAPNGKQCYTCGSDGCSEIMNCEGSEDRCISALVQEGSYSVSKKGCVSNSICGRSESTKLPGYVSKVECCEGNLCNGAESFTLNFLLMIVPLLYSILFY